MTELRIFDVGLGDLMRVRVRSCTLMRKNFLEASSVFLFLLVVYVVLVSENRGISEGG